MSALSDIANSAPFTGSEVNKAAETQRQEKLDKWHDIQKGIDAAMTVGEFATAGYGVTRGLTHFNRLLARKATQSTGQAISREAIKNLVKWDKRVAAIDRPQVLMNGIGGAVDGYQWMTADNSFDKWENGIETGADLAGVVGGMNWFKNLPYLRRIGGDKIDAVLDGLGYGAATWDIVKHLPPLSGALENIRQQSINKKAYGGSIRKGSHNDNGSDTVLIPRNAKNKTKISKEALDLYSNGPKRTARVAYHASFKNGKDSGIKEYASNEDMHVNPDGSITTRNGNTGSVILPDVNVYAQKDYNSAFDYSGANEVMGTIADFTPVVGDVKQGLEAANDLRKGNYKEAAIGAGLLLLPNVLEKPLKYAGKKTLNFLLDKAPDVVSKYRYLNKHYNPFIQEKRLQYQPYYFDYNENINAAKKEAVRSNIPIYNEDVYRNIEARRRAKKEFVANFKHARDHVIDEVSSVLFRGSN
jgi:hypothetical protein